MSTSPIRLWVPTIKDSTDVADATENLEELLVDITMQPEDENEEPVEQAANTMSIVFVASEVAPWSKTGGLGDVMGSLPAALAARGHRVMVVAPRYGDYEDAVDTEVSTTTVSHDAA